MSPVSFVIFVVCACTFFLISLNRWLSVSFSLNSKDFLFLPPSRFPHTHNPFLSVDYSVCHLVSKYLGIFLMFFCYWPLNYFHVGKGHTLYDLDPLRGFVSWPRIRSVLVHVHVEPCTLCPMPGELWGVLAGRWEQEASPPACSSSFISSFPLGWVFPRRLVFSLLHSVTHSQMKTQGRDLRGLGSGIPLSAVRLLSPPQIHSLHSSPGKAPPLPGSRI